MIIPRSINGAGNPVTFALDVLAEEPPQSRLPGGWSSIIGIVCALIGNVLISFALNTQRYAHLRLAREAGEISSIREASRLGKPKHQKTTYGTIQEDIAEERAKKNAKAAGEPIVDSEEPTHEDDSAETQALIPHVEEPTSDASSETTIRGDEKQPQQQKRKTYLRSPWWWLGITLMTIGEAGNFLAYGFAPASIVSPLGVVALIANCIIAPIMLKEKFRARDLLGVIIAVGGAVTVVISAKGSNPKLGPEEIGALLKRWEFLLYLGITCAAIIVLMFMSNKYGGKTVVIDIGLVGLFGGYTALSTKGVASLLSYRLFYIFTFPIAYLLVAVLVFTAVMQIKYVNRALQRFDSTQVIPTQFVCFTIFVVTGSAILYRDFEKTTADKLGEFFGGVALTFLGVWCITSGRGAKHDVVEDLEIAEDHNAEAISLVNDEEEDTPNGPASPTTPIATQPSLEQELANTFQPASSSDSSLSFVTATTALPGISPSSTNTIHAPDPATNLTRAPSSTRQQLAPPRLATTRSSPIVHQTSTSSRGTRSRSANPPAPSTPPQAASTRPPTHRHISDVSFSPLPAPSTTTNTTPKRPTAAPLGRHPSIVERMFSSSSHTFRDISSSLTLPLTPSLGPLTSPLSSGLSVVVASSLRGLPAGAAPGERDVGAQSESRRRRGSGRDVGTGPGTGRDRGRSSGHGPSVSASGSGRRPSALPDTRRSSLAVVVDDEEGDEDEDGRNMSVDQSGGRKASSVAGRDRK